MASTSDEPTPITAAGAGPSSAIASTIARKEPEIRTTADLDGQHVAADREDEEEADELEGCQSRGVAT